MEKLGIKRDFSKLSEVDHEILYFIHGEFGRLESEMMAKASKRKK